VLGGAAAGTAGWFSLDKETRGLLATVPTNRDLLFWSEPQRDAAFRALDRMPLLAKWRVVAASGTPSAAAARPAAEAGRWMWMPTWQPAQRGLVIVHDGKLRLERYGLGFDASRALDQLFGGQVPHLHAGGRGHARRPHQEHGRQGQRLHPEMKGSAYDDVSIRQLLTMTSGVRGTRTTATPTPTWPSSTTTSPRTAWTRW
jgi:hypothetical protein